MTQRRPNDARAPYILFANRVILVLGLWLIIAPVALGFVAEAALGNSLIIGLAIATIALVLLRRRRQVAGLSAATLALALWTIIAPFLLGYANDYNALWSHLFSGAALAVLAAFSLGEELGIE